MLTVHYWLYGARNPALYILHYLITMCQSSVYIANVLYEMQTSDFDFIEFCVLCFLGHNEW